MAAASPARDGEAVTPVRRHAALIGAVQMNCHIADARHATDLSLCIYLLQMREFFRWEQGLEFGMEPDWSAMRMALKHKRTDLHVRAVRDHLADLEVTLPALIERHDATALHFWFANYDGVRAQLFPALAQAYIAWCGGDRGRALRKAAQLGAAPSQKSSVSRSHG